MSGTKFEYAYDLVMHMGRQVFQYVAVDSIGRIVASGTAPNEEQVKHILRFVGAKV